MIFAISFKIYVIYYGILWFSNINLIVYVNINNVFLYIHITFSLIKAFHTIILLSKSHIHKKNFQYITL